MKNNQSDKLLKPAFIIVLILSLQAFIPVMNVMAQETRNPGSFNSINLALAADVELVKSNEFKIVLYADENDLEKIETKVNNNSLDIKKKNWADHIGNKVKMKIFLPDLKALTVSGSGKIFSSNRIENKELNLSVTGSGFINLEKNSAKSIRATITGSGNIKMGSDENADNLKLVITGSGSCESTAMKIGSVDVSITGSGSARVNVTDELNTHITGSGSVYYAGNPLVNATSTGSGKTKHL
ncbi:MAG: DUF2807 domain-containing protein [Bacteroidales bacterium]|nr:DUF2807 domain-containing protein [Bacteroidales bacterium]